MKNSKLGILTLAVVIIGIFIFQEPLVNGFSALIYKIQYWQSQFQRHSSQQLASLRDENININIIYSLVLLSWLYGVLHAAGPGHGKAIITTWALTQPNRYAQILLLSSAGSLLQALSAILWVAITIGLAQWFIHDSIQQSIWMNRISYVLLIIIGLYIIIRAGRKIHLQHNCHCTHHFAPNLANQTNKQQNARLLTILAIGLRPCSGALIVLSVAASWELWSVGILMTFAMAIGSAFTVGLLGLLVTYGQQKIASLITQHRFERYYNLLYILSILLGFILCALGVGLVLANEKVIS